MSFTVDRHTARAWIILNVLADLTVYCRTYSTLGVSPSDCEPISSLRTTRHILTTYNLELCSPKVVDSKLKV